MSRDPTQLWASSDAAERWRQTAAQRQQIVGAATELMLDAVKLQPGFRVLDLAAGTGDTSILVAQRVGPQGSVLAVDISAEMLEEAAAAAARSGLTNISTLVSDLEALDVPAHSFDAAISRFGLMFLADPVEGLWRIKVALQPGAPLAALVWSTAERNPFMSIPLKVSERLDKLPAEGSPLRRAVSLGGPGTFEGTLLEAGFRDVHVRPVAISREFDSVDAAADGIQLSSALVRELLGELEAPAKEHAVSELRRRLAEFAREDGHVILPGEALLGVARVGS